MPPGATPPPLEPAAKLQLSGKSISQFFNSSAGSPSGEHGPERRRPAAGWVSCGGTSRSVRPTPRCAHPGRAPRARAARRRHAGLVGGALSVRRGCRGGPGRRVRGLGCGQRRAAAARLRGSERGGCGAPRRGHGGRVLAVRNAARHGGGRRPPRRDLGPRERGARGAAARARRARADRGLFPRRRARCEWRRRHGGARVGCGERRAGAHARGRGQRDGARGRVRRGRRARSDGGHGRRVQGVGRGERVLVGRGARRVRARARFLPGRGCARGAATPSPPPPPPRARPPPPPCSCDGAYGVAR